MWGSLYLCLHPLTQNDHVRKNMMMIVCQFWYISLWCVQRVITVCSTASFVAVPSTYCGWETLTLCRPTNSHGCRLTRASGACFLGSATPPSQGDDTPALPPNFWVSLLFMRTHFDAERPNASFEFIFWSLDRQTANLNVRCEFWNLQNILHSQDVATRTLLRAWIMWKVFSTRHALLVHPIGCY